MKEGMSKAEENSKSTSAKPKKKELLPLGYDREELPRRATVPPLD